MKILIKKLILFLMPVTLLFISGLFLPPTPRATKSLLFADLQKDSLLINTPSPRIIFVGGSNLSFGLNSSIVKDSLSINPINTALHAGLGLKYMLENTLRYIKEGDIIIVAPEYRLFHLPYGKASYILLRTILDVNPQKAEMLSFRQIISFLGYLPKFTLTKFKPAEYFGFKESDVYSVNSFNEFGDVDAHWHLDNRAYEPHEVRGEFNGNVIRKLKEFEKNAKNKGAVVYISFPSLDEVSYKKSKDKVYKVEKALKKNNFLLLGSTERYVMDSEMMFNSRYHLNKKGVDYRTRLIIEDFKKAQARKNVTPN